MLTAACGNHNVPPGGDPGNRRLDDIGSDQVFRRVPDDADASGPVVRTPARYRKPGLDGGGWHGPAATLQFTSNQPPGSVFAYYADRATDFGWVATGNKNVLGYPEAWAKTYPDGTRANLTLTDLDVRARTRSTNKYVLNASA